MKTEHAILVHQSRHVFGEYGVVVGDDYAWGSAFETFLDSNT